MHTIIIDNTKYSLNLEQALASGVAVKVPKMRKVNVRDIPNGTPLRWHDKLGKQYRNFVMLDNTMWTNGQAVCIDWDNPVSPYGDLTWFSSSTNLEFFDIKTQKWVSEVEDE